MAVGPWPNSNSAPFTRRARDPPPTRKLLDELKPALRMLADVAVGWWEDSHLTCGEELTPGIVDRLDEADHGLLLLSPAFLGQLVAGST